MKATIIISDDDLTTYTDAQGYALRKLVDDNNVDETREAFFKRSLANSISASIRDSKLAIATAALAQQDFTSNISVS